MTNMPFSNSRSHRIAHVLLVALAIAAGAVAFWPSERTELAGQAAEQNSQVDLLIQVPPFARVESFEAPDEIEVLPSHLSTGYVDVEASTRMRVTFNSRQGFALQVNYDTAWVSRVEVWVDGQLLSVDEPRAKVIVAREIGRDVPVDMRYRLHLARGARAGQFAWPISLTVTPVT